MDNHTRKNFSKEIDKTLKGKIKSNNQIKVKDYTPKILVDNGVQNLPMLITTKHIKSIIYSQQKAQKLGLNTQNTNYHGLGKKLLIKVIDSLDNPKAVYKINDDNYLIISEFRDYEGKKIIIPIQTNCKGVYNNNYINENQIKSVYGKKNLEFYLINRHLKQIYKKEAFTLNEGIQYSDISNNASTDNSIASSNKDVNTTN